MYREKWIYDTELVSITFGLLIKELSFIMRYFRVLLTKGYGYMFFLVFFICEIVNAISYWKSSCHSPISSELPAQS